MYDLSFSQSLNKGVFPIAHIHESANLIHRVSIPNFVSKAEKQIWDREPGYKTTHLHPFPTWKAATLRPCWTGHSCARKWKRIRAMDLALAPHTYKNYKCSQYGKCCDSVQSTHVHHTLGLDGISGIWVHDIGNELVAKWGQITVMWVWNHTPHANLLIIHLPVGQGCNHHVTPHVTLIATPTSYPVHHTHATHTTAVLLYTSYMEMLKTCYKYSQLLPHQQRTDVSTTNVESPSNLRRSCSPPRSPCERHKCTGTVPSSLQPP